RRKTLSTSSLLCLLLLLPLCFFPLCPKKKQKTLCFFPLLVSFAAAAVMGRAPCCEKVGLKKGRWTAEEDQILTSYIQQNGEGKWRSLPKNAGLLRCGKSCRLRWINYLRADVKRGNISKEEEETIVKLHGSLGNRYYLISWSVIAAQLPGRTDNEIKNYWNSHLSRKIYTFRRSASFDSSASSTASSSSSTTTAFVDDVGAAAAARSSRKRKKAAAAAAAKEKSENPVRNQDEKTAAPVSGITTSAGENGSEGDGGGDLGFDGGELMMELDGNVEVVVGGEEEEGVLGPYEWLDSEMNRLKSKLHHCSEDGGEGQGKEDLASGGMKNGCDSERVVVESESNKGIESSSSSASNSNNCNCEHHDQGEEKAEEEWLDWDQITGGDEIQNIHWDEGDSSILSWLLDGNEQLQ
ncbi:unnamed protein product, partial [Linum tenue]